MNRSEALAALVTALAGIKKSAGYQYDVQSVRTGRAALAVSAKAALPVLTVHARQETPTSGGRAHLAAQDWTRTVVIDGHLPASETWDADLDALADDLRRCLLTADLHPRPDWDAIEFWPPDPDSNLCVVRATLRLTHLLVMQP